MGGVQRSTKFARYLPEFGWQPYVVTVKDILYYAFDNTLLNEVNHLPINRTGSLDPARMAKILSFINRKQKGSATKKHGNGTSAQFSFWAKLLRKVFYPDSKILWIPFAMNRIRNLSSKIQFDAVYSTSPPVSAHLIAGKLKLPWIADFRDYWTTEDEVYAPTKWHKRKYHKIMSMISQNAEKIIAVSEPIAESIRSNAKEQDKEKVIVIPNGFDPSDFVDTVPIKFDKFTISYLGNLNPQRSPTLIIKVLDEFIQENPNYVGKFQFYFIGKHFGITLPQVTNSVDEIVYFEDYMPHRESLAYALGSNALLFILSKENARGIVTGKIFEYLGTGKPILAIVPKHTSAFELLKNKPDCYLAEPDNPGQIKEALSFLLLHHLHKKQDRFSITKIPDNLIQYTRRNQARELANLLDACVGKHLLNNV